MSPANETPEAVEPCAVHGIIRPVHGCHRCHAWHKRKAAPVQPPAPDPAFCATHPAVGREFCGCPAPVPPATTGGADEAEGLRMLILSAWHDNTCPEGDECRSRAVHTVSALGVGLILHEIGNALLASDWLRERDLARDARTRADALREAADELPKFSHWGTLKWLRDRADQIGGAS